MKRTRQERIRLGIMIVGAGVFFVLVVLRLGQLQIVNAERYGGIVIRHSSGKVPIPATRGLIYDRYGRLVAKNVSRQSLYCHTDSRQDLQQAASYLENILGLKSGTAFDEFGLKVGHFRWIRRHLNDPLAARIEKEAPAALYLRRETVREYPYGRVGKQILGFTGIDNNGLAGFEYCRDSLLAGQKGFADIQRDGHRNIYRVNEQALVKPVPGQSVVLTIDWFLQEIVEEELERSVGEFNAKNGKAAFVDCRTGEILAMAHFDPNEKNPDKPGKLRVISDQFEPGSSFKPFTAAALLEAGLIKYEDTTYCEKGRWKVGRRTLHDDKELEWLTFRRIIELSSNIGLGKHVIEIDGPEMIATYKAFGFGQRTGCPLPGETPGTVSSPPTWSDYNKAAMAMGHSVAVNTLQMAVAMAAVANGGELLEAQLVLGHVEPSGYVARLSRPHRIARVTSEETSDSLRAFLAGVVTDGTGYPAASKFVSIAGKTGTAEIPDLINGGYKKNRFNASFCGFYPADQPLIAGIVLLEDPRPITYGGHTSGKAFKRIAERYTVSNPDMFLAAEQSLPRREGRLDVTVEAPNLVGRGLEEAQRIISNLGMNMRCPAAEGHVVWQYPAPDRLMLADDELVVAVSLNKDTPPAMIDLKGLTIRKATSFLEHAGIKYAVKGCGRVVSQTIPPGQIVSNNNTCRLECRPI